jgi:hypothetical protein
MNTGKAEVGKWFTCSVPISDMFVAKTYEDLSKLDTMLGLFVTNGTETAEKVEKYFDNFRLISK